MLNHMKSICRRILMEDGFLWIKFSWLILVLIMATLWYTHVMETYSEFHQELRCWIESGEVHLSQDPVGNSFVMGEMHYKPAQGRVSNFYTFSHVNGQDCICGIPRKVCQLEDNIVSFCLLITQHRFPLFSTERLFLSCRDHKPENDKLELISMEI